MMVREFRNHLGFTMSFLCVFICCCQVSHAQVPDDELKPIALKLHEKLSKVRREFGDVHFVYEFNEKGWNDYLMMKRISYWARDGEYFRIDEESLDPSATEARTRLIVRPEGYIQMAETEHGFAIVQLGSNDEGMERIVVHDLFCCSTRCFRLVDGEVPMGNIDGISFTTPLSEGMASHYTPLALSKDGDSIILRTRMDQSTDGHPNKAVYKVEYDLEEGVVLSYEQVADEGGSSHAAFRNLKSYDFERLRHVPAKISVEDKRVGGAWQSIEYKVEDVDWSPVPLGLFSFGPQGLVEDSVWVRRLVIFGIGVAVIVSFFLYRRWRKRG